MTWRAWVFLLITGLLVLIAAFLPDFVGAGWRLLHGPSARYRDWEIPVPRGWYAMSHGEALSIGRMVPLAFWQPVPTAVFLPIHVTPRFVFDQEVWERAQVAIQGQRGYRLRTGRGVVVAGTLGYCWEFSAVRDESRLWVTCVAPADRISVDFSGSAAFLSVFYSMLPGITRR